MSSELIIGGQSIGPGETKDINIFVAKQYDFTEISMPVKVIRGREDGPRLFVCAAIHGDEVIGVEIIKRLINNKALKKLRGTLIAAPIVNVFGFNNLTRYLPDRRDLNRCFPGSPGGSLAARLANLFLTEIVDNSTHGIDIHTGSRHRTNLPQVRAGLQDPQTAQLAREFHVPVILDADVIQGSLRQVVSERKIPLLVFEGGEALRYDEVVIRSGLSGILAVMNRLEMITLQKRGKNVEPIVAKGRYWVRAVHSGILIIKKRLGSIVKEGDLLGVISDPLGNNNFEIRVDKPGLIIGYSQLPLVNRGDAIFHIATFERHKMLEKSLEDFDDKFDYEER
ncbi:MAG: succinylglutamate desuccinylase/aspartoacylase family protein [Candidatus Omnitrophica bacterium]|nr:succinylglutamate desuccinylase/aspartoacylase family protein [Candidatus Omnitrophota bacterium]